MAARGSEVQYITRNAAHEHVHVGSSVRSGGRCARMSRFGRAIATFVIEPSQERALRKGKSVHVTSKAIQRAQLWHCTTANGGLAGRRRRKRRR